jgi:UDP-GlcNAc:undecaprenyl-phosphate GlcNAc-1-phosphate transferase
MYSLIVLAVVSLLAALVVTPVLRDLFVRWGIVDVPDGKRKTHSKPVATLGGVPIILSYLAAFGLLLLTPLAGGHVVRAALPEVWRLFPAVGLVFAIGIADDIRGLKPWQKLLGEAAACGLAIAAGVHLTGVAGFHFPPVLALIVTVIWLIGCANAVNLIDGMDGLAAGIALLAVLTIFIAALLQGNRALAIATVPLIGALLGFLRYNSDPASIFLGDSGSLTLGFLLGCYGILWSFKAVTMVGMTAPLLVLALPLADAGLAIVRRFLRQQPIFTADRGHIHHRLLAMGLKPRRVVLLLYAVVGGCAWLSLGVGLLHQNLAEPILFLFLVGVVLAINFLKYVEFGTARRMMLEGAFRRLLNARISLDAVEKGLQKAGSVEECWVQIASSYQAFGFTSVELRAGGRTFLDCGSCPGSGQALAGGGEQSSVPLLVDTLDCPPQRASSGAAGNGAAGDRTGGNGVSGNGTGMHGGWQVGVDLENGDHVELRREAGMHNHITLAAGFVEMLEQTLTAKLAEFREQEVTDEPGETAQPSEAGAA